MGETKKVYTAGRFGAKYGVGIRKRVVKVELKQKQKYTCPSCNSGRLKRINRGIFLCSKCQSEFAGGTFIPHTLTGGIIKKMVSQKNFLPLAKQLIEIKEGNEEAVAKEFGEETESIGLPEKPGHGLHEKKSGKK